MSLSENQLEVFMKKKFSPAELEQKISKYLGEIQTLTEKSLEAVTTNSPFLEKLAECTALRWGIFIGVLEIWVADGSSEKR